MMADPAYFTPFTLMPEQTLRSTESLCCSSQRGELLVRALLASGLRVIPGQEWSDSEETLRRPAALHIRPQNQELKLILNNLNEICSSAFGVEVFDSNGEMRVHPLLCPLHSVSQAIQSGYKFASAKSVTADTIYKSFDKDVWTRARKGSAVAFLVALATAFFVDFPSFHQPLRARSMIRDSRRMSQLVFRYPSRKGEAPRLRSANSLAEVLACVMQKNMTKAASAICSALIYGEKSPLTAALRNKLKEALARRPQPVSSDEEEYMPRAKRVRWQDQAEGIASAPVPAPTRKRITFDDYSYMSREEFGQFIKDKTTVIENAAVDPFTGEIIHTTGMTLKPYFLKNVHSVLRGRRILYENSKRFRKTLRPSEEVLNEAGTARATEGATTASRSR